MKNISACRTASGWLIVCLLLAFHLHTSAQGFTYPKQMDEVYIGFEPSGMTFDARASVHNPVRFRFPTWNSGEIVAVDFKDGNGSQIINSGEIKVITYAANLEQAQIDLYWSYSYPVACPDPNDPDPCFQGTWGNHKFQLNFNPSTPYPSFAANTEVWDEPGMVGQTYTPPASNAYPSGSPYNAPVTADGIVHVLYAHPDKQLRKPFILVEGFDPIIGNPNKYPVKAPDGSLLGYGGLRWDCIVTGRTEWFDEDPTEAGVPHTPQFALLPNLISQIQAKGYDLVYVDFADAGTYVQANAEFLIKVIEQVNNRKIGNEPSVLIGASMGGIVSRYALAKLEQQGKSHCVGLFGTFDTPHNGANIPLSIQALGWYFHAIGQTDEIWDALNTPAARQQAMLTLGGEIQAGRVSMINEDDQWTTDMDFSELTASDFSTLRTTMQNELSGLGWPKLPRKIALLNGMKDGTLLSNQGFGPGQTYYDANIDVSGYGTVFKIVLNALGGATADYNVHRSNDCIKHPIDVTRPNTLLSMAQPSLLAPCQNFGTPPLFYRIVHLQVNQPLPNVDNAPSGFRTDLRSLHSRLSTSLPDGGSYVNAIKFPIMAFVPTWSSLAMATPFDNPSLFVDLTTTEFRQENLPNLKVPNFDHFYAPTGNLRHVELDGGMISFIMEELTNLEAENIQNTLAETYNFGLRRTQIPNISVLSGGVLNINNPGPTGYVQSAPGGAAVKPVFTTQLLDCGQAITVESGGQYNIGALDKSQHGITEVWEGATVHIRSGGTLHITSDQSMLRIREGAQLVLDAGAIVHVESPNSNIRIEGTLVVNGNFTFQGRGHFDFWNDHGLLLGPQANAFRVYAHPTNTRSIRLSDQTRLHIPAGKGLDLNRGGVQYLRDNTLLLEPGAWAEARSTRFVGTNEGATGFSGENPRRLIVENCSFSGVDAPFDISGSNNFSTDLTQVRNTHFEQYETGSHIARRAAVLFEGCTLTGAGFGAYYGIFSDYNFALVLRDCDISDHSTNFANSPQSLSHLVDKRAGLKVAGGLLLWMDGGSISNCDVGISNLEDTDEPLGDATNVLLNHFATIRDCDAGIGMDGDATKGLVMMDCARLLNNSMGILGEDIRLMIDPTVFAQQNGTPANPNAFTLAPSGSGANNYFKICYRDFPSPGQPIPAKMNYWGKVSGGITSLNPTPLADVDLKRPQGAAACAANVTMDVSGAVTRPPVGCDLEEFCDPNGDGCVDDCLTLLTGLSTTTVKGKFMDGYGQLKSEQFDAARDDFGDVAARQIQPAPRNSVPGLFHR